MFIHNLPTIDNLLSGEHHTAGEGYAADDIGSFCLTAFLVVGEVRGEVFVQVALLQDLTLRTEFLIHEQLFVGGHRGIDTVDGHTGGCSAVDHTDETGGVLEVLRVVGLIHDTCLIQTMQTVDDGSDIIF